MGCRIIEIEFKGRDMLSPVQDALHQVLEAPGTRNLVSLEMAWNEALVNAVLHGKPEGEIRVLCRFFKHGRFSLRIRNEGEGFPAHEYMKRWEQRNGQMPEISEERLWMASGRGLLIMSSFMEKVRYNAAGTEVLLAGRLQR